ncbi:MAG: hypothetical protein P9L97_05765 [Candidatus Tenebribacter davisii]|nr:hypothetical protein [Candidatus Tenebribacter davisii]
MAATRLSFSYPEELKEKIMELALRDGRTLSSYVQKVLVEDIEKNYGEASIAESNPESGPKKTKVNRKKRTRK